MKHAGVGDQHHFGLSRPHVLSYLGTGLNDLIEIPKRGGLSVARESDVVKSPHAWWSFGKSLELKKIATHHKLEHATEFRQQRVGFHKTSLALSGAIDLA
ncbi:MAG: hypothetical protein VX034_15580, partial [Planctomycetota bacterium]|nr:hypothetical protein [Planctomycetota bacterium]